MNTSKSNSNSSKGIAATGIIASLAASSCCIPPLIASVAGIGGIAGSLSWLEPLRPYFIGLAVVAIGYAWYSHYKPKAADDCGCDIEKPKFYQTKGYLLGMTMFACVNIIFPYYSKIFYPSMAKNEVVINNASDIQSITFEIEGMTCGGCEAHVENDINKLPGIIKINASYEDANAKVAFDQTKINLAAIEDAINGTGYIVKSKNKN